MRQRAPHLPLRALPAPWARSARLWVRCPRLRASRVTQDFLATPSAPPHAPRASQARTTPPWARGRPARASHAAQERTVALRMRPLRWPASHAVPVLGRAVARQPASRVPRGSHRNFKVQFVLSVRPGTIAPVPRRHRPVLPAHSTRALVLCLRWRVSSALPGLFLGSQTRRQTRPAHLVHPTHTGPSSARAPCRSASPAGRELTGLRVQHARLAAYHALLDG